MYTKTKYVCSLCNTEYDNEISARNCDNLGIPQETAHIKEGDTISFIRNITNEVGAVSNFVNQSGVVKHIECMRNNRTNTHQHTFIVLTSDEQGEYEGYGALLDVEGKSQMFLAAAPRYKVGFAESLKQPKTET